MALSEEYTFRYGKTHKSQRVIEDCINYVEQALNHPTTELFLWAGFGDPPLAMP
jgi:hypothetical protein